MSKKMVLLILLSVSLLFSACGGEEEAKGPVTVASKIDTEGALLGQMIILALENEGFEVNDRTEFGPTNVIRQAIINDEIDLYPEYTGNGGFFFSDTDPEIWKDAQKGYETVRDLDREANGLVWLEPATANNTWAIAVRGDVAEENNLVSLEDMGRYVNEGGRVKLAASEEFVTRVDALPAFEEAYGFNLTQDQLLIFAGGNTAQTIQAAGEGTDGVNFAMAYGTDGPVSALGLIVLEDSKGVQPVYEPAPLVREAILEEYPEIEEILQPVFASLNLETLQRMNAAIALEGRDARAVAREHLEAEGLID